MSDEVLYGKVISVNTRNLGEPATNYAAIGATTIFVADASTFNEGGGYVLVGQEVLYYEYANISIESLFLPVGPTVAVEAQDLIEFYPAQPIKTAWVDIGDDGDPVLATVPHALVQELPDGVREANSYESVELVRRGAFEYVVADVKGQTLPPGVIHPDRLSLGLTGELVQDPQFLTSIWATDVNEPWSILGPDVTYPMSNYLSCASSDGALYSLPLTHQIPINDEQAIIAQMEVRYPVAILSASTWVRLRIRYFEASPIAKSIGPVEVGNDMVEWVFDPDLLPDVWNFVDARFNVPPETTSVVVQIEVEGQTAGAIDFIKPSVHIFSTRLQSLNFVEGETGFSLDEATGQVENLNVLQELGADIVSTRALAIDGRDLETEVLAPLPYGVTSYDISSTGNHTANIGQTETKIWEYSMGETLSGRLYRLWVQGHVIGTADLAIDFRLRYTANGTTPGTGSTIFRNVRVNAGSTAFEFNRVFAPGASDNIRVALTMEVASATGTAYVYNNVNERALIMYSEDLGLFAGAQDAGTLSQKSVGTGSPQVDPVRTYTKVFWSTWSRSYESDYSTRPDDPNRLYQGVSSTRIFGNQRSLFGFDYAAIQAATSGATIKKITLTYRVQAAAGNDGIRLYLSSHNHTAKPATFNPANVNNDRHNWTGRKEGSTYTQVLSNTIGNEFKAGTTRGLGFGPAPSSSFDAYYGYCYGGTTSYSRPKLTITYSK